MGCDQCRLVSEVSPGSFLQDQLVQRQVGYRPAQTGIFLLEVFHAAGLIHLQAAILLVPAIVRYLGYPNRPNCIRDLLAL